MNWIESHVSLGNHPKTRRLARELGVSLPTAVGHLQYFWWFVAAYALDGDLSRFDAGDIADGAMWEGDAEAFVSALRSSRFIDEPNRVHDWTQYVERYLKARDGSTRGNHRRWHEGPDGKPSADCELCIASGSVPMSPPTPNGTRPPTPLAVAPEDRGESPPESADLTGPELTRPDPTDQVRPDGPKAPDPKARGSAAPIDVGAPLGEVLTSAPPPLAPGLSMVQDGLVKGLHEADPIWRKLTFGAVNKLNKRFSRAVVVMALQRCREEKAVPADPFPFVQALCDDIVKKTEAAHA